MLSHWEEEIQKKAICNLFSRLHVVEFELLCCFLSSDEQDIVYKSTKLPVAQTHLLRKQLNCIIKCKVYKKCCLVCKLIKFLLIRYISLWKAKSRTLTENQCTSKKCRQKTGYHFWTKTIKSFTNSNNNVYSAGF